MKLVEAGERLELSYRQTKRLDLKWVFCLETGWVVSNDGVVRFENRFPQLEPKRNQDLGAGARVTLRRHGTPS